MQTPAMSGVVVHQGPQTLFQLFLMLFQRFLKGFKWRILFGLLSFVVVFVVHTYLMVVVNDTLRIVENNKLMSMILNLASGGLSKAMARERTINVMIFWMVLSTLVFGTIGRWIAFGIKQFFLDLWGMLILLFHLRSGKSGSRSLPLALIGFGLAMIASIFVLNNAVCILLAIFLFLTVSQREKSFLVLVMTLAKSDAQRLFRIKNKKQFNIDNFAIFVWGLILGFLISGLIPPAIFGKTIVSTVVKVMIFVAIIVIGSLNSAKKKTAVQLLLFLLTVAGFILLRKANVLADDTGWTESGRNFQGWIRNSGTPTALMLSLSPALLSSLANVLGPMFPGFMRDLLKNPNTNPYEYIRTHLTPEQFDQVRQLTQQRHQEGVDKILAENTSIGFIKDFFEGVYNDVKELSQAYIDFKQTLEVDLPRYLAENPLEAFNNSMNFVRGVGQAVSGLGNEALEIIKDLARDPSIISETLGMTASELVNDPVGSGQKVAQTLYEMSGLKEIVECTDPNKSAVDRAGLYAMGVIKMYGLIDGAGTVADVSRAGVNRLAGMADDLIKSSGGQGGQRMTAQELQRLFIAQERRQMGEAFANDFVRTVKSGGSEDDIVQRIMNIQQDRSAMRALNEMARNSDEAAAAVRAYNQRLSQIFNKVDREVAEDLSTKLACSSDDIQVVAATNKTGQIKVGFDRDITIRINGRDIPPEQWADIYKEKLFNNTSQYFPPSATQESILQKLDHALTDKFHPEAYGSNERALDLAVNKQAHLIADPEQVGQAITYKGMKHFDEAAQIQQLNPIRYEDEISEGMRQLTKQWDNQVTPAAQYYNATIESTKLRQAIDIMKGVNSGAPTVEIERALQAIGYTKEQVALDLGKQFEMIVKLGRQI